MFCLQNSHCHFNYILTTAHVPLFDNGTKNNTIFSLFSGLFMNNIHNCHDFLKVFRARTHHASTHTTRVQIPAATHASKKN